MRSTSCGVEADQRGATLVEFLGVMLLASFAFAVLLQAALWVWTRNVVVNAADEGARIAAEAGRPLDDGDARTRSVLRDGLGGRAARFAVDTAQSGDAVVVRVTGPAPQVVPFLPVFTVVAEARAFDEDEVLAP